MTKCLVSWIGSHHNRVRGVIEDIVPDKIIYLIDCQTDEMHSFQMENLKAITKGNKIYQVRKNNKRVKIEKIFDKTGKLLFRQMFNIIQTIRNEDSNTVIIFDITSAPKNYIYIIQTLSSLISTINSPISILYKSKSIDNNPGYYAANSSKKFRNMTMLLKDYRTKEAKDKGGNIKNINVPRISIDILNSNSPNYLFEIALFHHIPSNEEKPVDTKTIYDKLISDDEKIIKMYYENIIQNEKRSEKNAKDKKKKDKAKLFTKITEHLHKLEEWGLVELTKINRKRGYKVKRALTGDLLSLVADDLYFSNSKKYKI